MDYNFDQTIQRRQTGSYKWDWPTMQSILPMWVADMDFPSPPCVGEALAAHAQRGQFGYAVAPDSLVEVTVQRMKERHGWDIKPEWIVWLPGLETGLTASCMAVGEGNDQVVAFPPVYPPFLNSPVLVGRELLTETWQCADGRWLLDFDSLEEKLVAADGRAKLLLLCNPHNPVGAVWSREDLEQLNALCLKYNLVLCSDEVHCDLILDDQKHFVAATLSEDIAQQSITLMAPSKTFNIAGLGCGMAIIPNDKLRRRFKRSMNGYIPMVSPTAFCAAEAAYRDGESWRVALVDYLRSNRDYLMQRLKDDMPQLKMLAPEATYLAWIDCTALELNNPTAFFHKGGVGFTPGSNFKADQFIRLNFGCPRSVLKEGLDRMQAAMAD